jgi:hypothetical protein
VAAALAGAEACSDPEDVAAPADAAPGDAAAQDSDTTPRDGGDRPPVDGAAPPPPEVTSLLNLAERSSARAYGVAAVPGTSDIVAIGVDDLQSDAGDRSALALRTDLSGAVRWARRFGGTFNDQFLSMALVGTTIHALGITRTVFTGTSRNTDALWVQIDAANSAVLGSRHLGTTGDEDVLGSAPVPDGLVLVGTLDANTDAYIAKLSTTTNTVVWAKRWATPGTEALRTVNVVAGGLLAIGHSTIGEGGRYEPVVARFDDAGNHQWSRRISGLHEAYLFSGRATADGIVVVGQVRAMAGAPLAPIAMKLSPDGTSIAWAKIYSTQEGGSWRASAVVAADPTYGLPETVAVGGFTSGDVLSARLSTRDGAVVSLLTARSPAGATLALDREVVWERADKGFGFLFSATPTGSVVSSIGVGLPNRLLALPQGCAWSASASVPASDIPSLTSAALAPTISDVAFTVADTGPTFTFKDVAFTPTAACN